MKQEIQERKKYTDAMIKRLHPKNQKYYVLDSEVIGLRIYVQISGDKSFYLQRYVKEFKYSKKTKIGDYPEMSIRAARKLAAEIKADNVQGKDPIIAAAERAKEKTLGEVIDEYVDKRLNNKKDKSKSLLDEDSSISDVITEAFDNVELTTIGKLCLDARVSKSLTQEQASNLLKVRVKIIKDFENGDQIDLPGTAYKIGFVRSYARLLELDSDLLVKEFKENLEVNDFKEEYKFLSPEIHNNKILPIGALLSFFIALIIYSGWYYTDRNNKIDTVSVNGVEKKIEKITESYDNSYVIIEENYDPKNSFPSKIKNYNNETKESMFEEKIDIAEVKKNLL